MAQLSERKIILIGPEDVEAELDTIRGVLQQANKLRGEEKLIIWNWRTDSTPGLHLDGPQGLTDEQMQVADADLVIAIFWTRLGTPVLDDESGTAHELRLAWQAWMTTGKPEVWIYFCKRAVPQAALEDQHQFPALQNFKKSLPKEQKRSEFGELDQLGQDFTNHLGIWLKASELHATGLPVVLQGVLTPPDASRTVPRPNEVLSIAASFMDGPIVCLHGISGSGKTRLAAQYVRAPQRLAEHSQGTLWYDVSDSGTLDEMLATLPEELVGADDVNPLTRCKNLLTTLRLRSMLLVLDDFHNADKLSFSPLLKAAGIQSTPSTILLLSRVALLLPDVAEVGIRPWTVAEIRNLLEQLGVHGLRDEILVKLTRRTGGLPLAIRFFAVLVKNYGRDPETLLAGELTQTPLTESWYADIKANLSESETSLLRYFSLAEPYITSPVLRRAEARLQASERARAFIRLQTLLLVESRGAQRWAVHPFVAEHTLNDTDDATKRAMLRDLSQFSRDALRNLRPGQITHQSLVAGIRAARYAQRAQDLRLTGKIILSIASAAKRMGYYRALRDLCQGYMVLRGRHDPWIKYHYAHCELILGNPRATVMVLSALKPADNDVALVFASARILADAQSQLGQRSTAIAQLRLVLQRKPGARRGDQATYQQAESMLAGLLIEDGALDEARTLATRLARVVKDDRSLAVIQMLLGQIDLASSPRAAEMRFRSVAAKFRSLGDQRGYAWALRSLVDAVTRQRKGDGETRRLAREALSTCARIGESTHEYLTWLERIQARYAEDAAILNLVDHEIARVGGDLGLARL